MLLKVSDGNGGWVLLDEVEEAHMKNSRFVVSEPEQLMPHVKEDVRSFVAKECFTRGKEITVGVLEYVSRGNKRKALFTGTAYVCNDAGDTLDRFSVERRVEKKR